MQASEAASEAVARRRGSFLSCRVSSCNRVDLGEVLLADRTLRGINGRVITALLLRDADSGQFETPVTYGRRADPWMGLIVPMQ